MRFGRLLPGLSVFVAAGALIVLTGTGAAATQPGRSAPAAITASLAAPAALDSYLRSIGVSRASLVTQRGARNYAGPNCPGKGWTCTTSKRVLQIATDHGKNKVECAGNLSVVIDSDVPSNQSCTFLQTGGGTNSATCHQRSDSSAAVQTCDILQIGTKNNADVHQTVHANGNDNEQTATQTAIVDQSGGSNKSHVKQDVKQQAKDGFSQSQDVQQSAVVDQTATGAGGNASTVHQDQDLSAKGSATNQSQNTNDLGLADCVSGLPFDPNACAKIDQSAVNGDNASHLKQSISESAKTNAVALEQQQGSFHGGLDGHVHQVTASGRSLSKADQSKRQDMVAAPETPADAQSQYDPIRCCGTSSQHGGSNNSEQIDQSSTQDASEENAFQQLDLLGESWSPEGSCSVSQKARNNSDSTTNSDSLDTCDPPLVLLISCTNESEGGGCTTPLPDEGCSYFFPCYNPDLYFANPND